MEQFRVFMSKKVAGVPVGIIAVIIMGGLLYMAIRMRPAPAEELTEDATDVPEESLPENTDQPIFQATPAIIQPSGSTVASVQLDNNILWKRRAIEWLTANGETLGDATTTIQKYVNGESLSQREGAIRDKAVGQFGLPPEDFEAGNTKVNQDTPYKGPASRQGEPPLKHIVKGKSDDTPAELARLYYGLDNNATRTLIESRNSDKEAPYAFGQAVQIPENRQPRYYRATGANKSLYSISRKNGIEPARLQALNPGVNFPVKPGTRVRIK